MNRLKQYEAEVEIFTGEGCRSPKAQETGWRRGEGERLRSAHGSGWRRLSTGEAARQRSGEAAETGGLAPGLLKSLKNKMEVWPPRKAVRWYSSQKSNIRQQFGTESDEEDFKNCGMGQTRGRNRESWERRSLTPTPQL